MKRNFSNQKDPHLLHHKKRQTFREHGILCTFSIVCVCTVVQLLQQWHSNKKMTIINDEFIEHTGKKSNILMENYMIVWNSSHISVWIPTNNKRCPIEKSRFSSVPIPTISIFYSIDTLRAEQKSHWTTS